MRFWTIVTSGYPISEISNRLQEWAWREAAHRLPRRLAYWSFIDSGIRALGPNDVVPEARYMDLLERLEK
jgi:hypothetical protein